MRQDIEAIKHQVDIVDIISSVVTLQKAGRNFKANCPFHGEKTPSFIVSPDRQTWRCFGACHEGGDVISFLMKYENLTFYEVMQELSKKTGIPLTQSGQDDREWNKKKVLYDINQLAAKLFAFILHKKPVGKEARDYIKQRGLTPAIVKTFEIGYIPHSRNTLATYLLSKKFSMEDIVASGLAGFTDDKKGLYDRFKDRLMFPIKDQRGNIVGFAGRLIKDLPLAKYINTPETAVYRKRDTLYGIDLAKKAITERKSAIIVEGELDMIACFTHGITNTVAIKGSAFTTEQLKLLKRYTDHLILGLDIDPSGLDTTKRTILEAEAMDFRVDVLDFDFAKDPDEALKKNPIAFKKAVENPVSAFDFIIDKALENHRRSEGYEKKAVADEVIPFITKISNPILRDHYTKKISEALDVTQQAIEESIIEKRQKEAEQKIVKKESNEKQPTRQEHLEQTIASQIVQAPKTKDAWEFARQYIQKEDFSQPSIQTIFEHLTTYFEKSESRELNTKVFVAQLPPQLHSIFDTLYLFDLSIIDSANDMDFKKRLLELKKINLKQQISKELETLGSKASNNSGKLPILTKTLSEVEKQLAFL